MTLNLKPDDIEIENTLPNPIIHIFPNDTNPYNAVEELLKGYFLNNNLTDIYNQLEELIKNKEQPEYLIMAYKELERILENAFKESQIFTHDFISKQSKK